MRLVELVDQLLDSMEADDRLALHPRRPDRDRRRLPRGPARGRAADRAADRRGPPGDRAVADPAWTSSSCRARRSSATSRSAGNAPRRSAGRCRVGYLPDMFGHIAQMPQILRRAGIDRAVVWRGVPAAIDRHHFTWRVTRRVDRPMPSTSSAATATAPTCSTIPDRLGDKLGRVRRRPDARSTATARSSRCTGPTTPSPPRARRTVVERVNASGGDVEVRIETLTEYLDATGRCDPGPAARCPDLGPASCAPAPGPTC